MVCTLWANPQARSGCSQQGRKAEDIERLSVYQVVTPYLFQEIQGGL